MKLKLEKLETSIKEYLWRNWKIIVSVLSNPAGAISSFFVLASFVRMKLLKAFLLNLQEYL